MQPARWKQIEELYHAALEREAGERAAFLAQACDGDVELRREVESLLAQYRSAEGVLDRPAWEAAPSLIEDPPRIALLPGEQLGPYRIEGPLGSGGMGQVYKARDTRLGRAVAIKTLTEPFSGRFEREARSISSLNHPHICTLHDVGPNYLVMELLEGETLAARLQKGPLPVEQAMQYGAQIADALEAAHEKGVIHRDLKPANIMVVSTGSVKVLDFGLAKATHQAAAADPSISRAGAILGTPAYMSPEQALGNPVDKRTDLFSFGVVLYEMVTGERPFLGSSPMAVADSILHAQPCGLGESPVPGKLKAIIRKLLEKDQANRYGSAGEVSRELKALETSLSSARLPRLSRNVWVAVGAAVVLASVVSGWLWRGSSRERWALETATPEITRLVEAGEYVKAAALTQEARSVLPKDATLAEFWRRATGEVSIASVPSGADVSIRPYRGDPNVWQTIGKTPLQAVRVPREIYVWRVVKPGFAVEFFIDQPPSPPLPGFHSRLDRTLKLRPEGTVPPEMVVVSGGMAGLDFPLAEAPSALVDDFLIDRHEVTNEEYKKFVDAGGYQKREFWKQSLVRDGRTVPWEDAVALFHDATGRPGPATWEVGDYPKGREKYPVAGVSWHEAAAYAEFAGKSLPTAYHWKLASQSARYTPLITAGSNFRSEGTQPVGSGGALSGSGTTDMAGNVKEWCLNEAREGRRLILGGGFGEPNYMFFNTDAQSPWDRLANFGFRGVKLNSPPSAAATAHLEVLTRDYWKEKPVGDDVFKAYTALYAYDKGELNPQVEETATMQEWSRTKVSFDAAYGHERVTAYLFLPKNAPPPFQTVVNFPGGFAFLDDKLDLSSIEDDYDFLLKSGRALLVPIYKGSYERRDGYVPGRSPSAFLRDHVIAWSKDLGRSLDYLETRKDIDSARVAYFGFSQGGAYGALLPAVEKRIVVAILSSGGFYSRRFFPEVDPFNFITHVTIPVLMLNGRYDTTFPTESSQRPLFHWLGSPGKDKKHVIYEVGHAAFPRPAAVRETLDWLDKYLGPVRH